MVEVVAKPRSLEGLLLAPESLPENVELYLEGLGEDAGLLRLVSGSVTYPYLVMVNTVMHGS